MGFLSFAAAIIVLGSLDPDTPPVLIAISAQISVRRQVIWGARGSFHMGVLSHPWLTLGDFTLVFQAPQKQDFRSIASGSVNALVLSLHKVRDRVSPRVRVNLLPFDITRRFDRDAFWMSECNPAVTHIAHVADPPQASNNGATVET